MTALLGKILLNTLAVILVVGVLYLNGAFSLLSPTGPLAGFYTVLGG